VPSLRFRRPNRNSQSFAASALTLSTIYIDSLEFHRNGSDLVRDALGRFIKTEELRNRTLVKF